MAATTPNADASHVAQIASHLAEATETATVIEIEIATARETRTAAKNPKIGAVNHVTDANAAIKNSEEDKRLMFLCAISVCKVYFCVH